MPIATVTDVEGRWRPLSDSETLIAETRLADAERSIRRRIKDLDARIAADPDGFGADVVQVIADAVIRVLLNPDRKRQEQIDDYKYTRDRTISDGTLRITAADWLLLGVSVGARKAFSIDTTPAAAMVSRDG